MAQEQIWDKEYRNSKLLTKDNKPQSDVVRFVKFLRKDEKFEIEGKKVLDLGSGAGRNSFYFAELGAIVTGIEISKTAVEISKKNISNTNLSIKYIKQSIGEIFPVQDSSIDIVLDITSSNSLNEEEREVYLNEVKRALNSEGYFFVKALCKDGDENAKFLLKNHPGKEKDTYIMPELGVTERVWSKEDFEDYYGKYFNIIHMEKKTTYSRMNNRVYKRNFWIVYMKG
ncbi:MAG: methyltransferase domain-containing protein [Patescibacteria group bacterium]